MKTQKSKENVLRIDTIIKVMKFEDLWFSVNKIYLRIYYFGIRFNIDTYKC